MLEKLFERHASYAYKWLIELSQQDDKIYLVNNNASVIYKEQVYGASSFMYAPKEQVLGFNSEGSLKITTVDNNLIYWLERSSQIELRVIAVMIDNEIQEIKTYSHKYCTATWTANEITMNFKKDDRLEMAYPSLIYNAHTNRR